MMDRYLIGACDIDRWQRHIRIGRLKVGFHVYRHHDSRGDRRWVFYRCLTWDPKVPQGGEDD
jgi:hypothetical protein